MATVTTIILVAIATTLSLFLSSYIILVILTYILAVCTEWRSKYPCSKARLLIGRVSHCRKLPTVHGFSYPIFMALIDLEQDFNDAYFPLSYVAQLCNEDHYKNREGEGHGHGHGHGEPVRPQENEHERKHSCSLFDRTLRLVAEKTNNKFQPTRETHSVKLLTHLRYYGYCFNPVSFYYILKKDMANPRIDAMVAEVSNTPWNEMQCYVLHPDSVHVQTVQDSRSTNSKDHPSPGINYIFPKTFHVSPFMAMDQLYDWTFWEMPLDMALAQDQTNDQQIPTPPSSLNITNSVFQNQELYFNANLQLKNAGHHPYTIATQLVKFPIFCAILQLWIHLQAFAVFYKGVEYVPHPEGSETMASALVGTVMTPVFALKDFWNTTVRRKGKCEKTKSQ